MDPFQPRFWSLTSRTMVAEAWFAQGSDQRWVEVPGIHAGPYGLGRNWGIRLQEPTRVAVFLPLLPRVTDNPGIKVGVLYPPHTDTVELAAHGGYAVALLELPRPVELGPRAQHLQLYFQRANGRPWLAEPSLLEWASRLLVVTLTGKAILRRTFADIKLARDFLKAVSNLADVLWPSNRGAKPS